MIPDHPFLISEEFDWQKWRLTFKGGTEFINHYLQRYSDRESAEEYQRRLNMTPNPAFAKSALIEIRNSIFQRINDVQRIGGPVSYQNAIKGLGGGVDLSGSSMNSFIGRHILDELLLMKRVGVYVDNEPDVVQTLADEQKISPYLYWYRVEDIRNWAYNRRRQLVSILLRDTDFAYDEHTFLTHKQITGYRLIQKMDGFCVVTRYNEAHEEISTVRIDVPEIPFHIADIGQSLMEDVANYQIALLNLNSSDIAYAMDANFPFYTEQSDGRPAGAYFKDGNDDSETDHVRESRQIEVGPKKGRTYPMGADRPDFIHPSSEPLEASMAKQESLKNDIRRLVHLAVANLSTKYNSADSKKVDNQGLEAGLSNIGLVLQHTENQIAKFWAMYLRTEPAKVAYPNNYSLETEDERRAKAKELREMLPVVPSSTYQRAIKKQIANAMLQNKVSYVELEQIYQEIDRDLGIDADIDNIVESVKVGILSPETAGKLIGYPEGEAQRAQDARVEAAARIMEAQMSQSDLKDPAARGVPELDPDPNSPKREKEASQAQTGGRGKGRKAGYKKGE